MADREVTDLQARASAALRDALKARDAGAVDALRSLLSAIANAEAVDVRGEHVFPPKIGVSAGEVARSQLSTGDVVAIVQREIAERMAAAAEYERLGRADQATALRDQAAVLRRFLEGST